MRNRNCEIYNKGDIVTYNGEICYAFDATTRILMQANLITGLEYRIIYITYYNRNKDSICYELEQIVHKVHSFDCAWYPYQSFFIDYSLKYNLK